MLILSRSDTDLVELIPCVIAHCVSISNSYVTYPKKKILILMWDSGAMVMKEFPNFVLGCIRF